MRKALPHICIVGPRDESRTHAVLSEGQLPTTAVLPLRRTMIVLLRFLTHHTWPEYDTGSNE